MTDDGWRATLLRARGVRCPLCAASPDVACDIDGRYADHFHRKVALEVREATLSEVESQLRAEVAATASGDRLLHAVSSDCLRLVEALIARMRVPPVAP